jgi:ATP-binding cassette, subfamily B, bacterial PglK
MGVIGKIRKLVELVQGRERFLLFGALVAMMVSAITDMLGLISMIPFLLAVADVSNIENVWYLAWAYDYFGFTGIRPFLIGLALFAFSLLVINNGVRLVTTWLNIRVSMDIRHKFHIRLFEHYLYQPYTFYLEKNTAELIDKLTFRVNSVVAGTLTPVLLIVTHGLTGIMVFAILLWQDFFLTMFLIGILATFYLLVYRVVQRKVIGYGKEMTRIDPALLKLGNEAFGGIKELKTFGRETSFIRRFTRLSWDYSSTYLKQQVVVSLPSILVEVMAIGSIMLIGGYLIWANGNLLEVLPLLGVYVVASRRIQPALQNVFTQIGQIQFHQPSFDLIWPDLEAACDESQHNNRASVAKDVLELRDGIEIRGLEFSYHSNDRAVIDHLDIDVPAMSTVGIVGGSGVGKTTLVDLMLGLLDPVKGRILVDSQAVDMGRGMVGYVPQSVYLADDTVRRNIAFGLDDEEIDDEAVFQAAKLAQVSDFIESELANKYDTMIGEQGIRLSGGQRQRLGIARALYHNPSVIILDEATSSLDGITELSFMQAVRGLARKKTIIIIAHRLTTLRDCDIIYLLEKGKVADSGSYDDLLIKNAHFASMANERNRVEKIAKEEL